MKVPVATLQVRETMCDKLQHSRGSYIHWQPSRVHTQEQTIRLNTYGYSEHIDTATNRVTTTKSLRSSPNSRGNSQKVDALKKL